MSKLRELFGNMLIKQSKDKGDVVVTQTATEKEFVVNKCKALKLDVVIQALSPDMSYIYMRMKHGPTK
jgi:hypothetical protein